MKRRILTVVLTLLALLVCLPAMAEMTEDGVFVIKKWKSYDALVEMIEEAGVPQIIDISKQSISMDHMDRLFAAYPDVEFRYRIRVFKQHVLYSETSLDFAYNEFEDMDEMLRCMSYFPNATYIRALGTLFTAEEMERFVTAYPDVEYLFKVKMGSHRIRTDITAFCTKHALYTKKRYNENDLAVFKYCRNLKALDFGHNSVTSLEFIRDLPPLQILLCCDNKITDLTPLESQPGIIYLELFYNYELEDISPITNLPDLIDLHIGDCNISDITPLFELKKLDRLWMPDNPIPEEQVEAIRAAMPNTKINTTASKHPTAEGWRQGHPRYLKIADMFQKNKYVNFP